MKSNTGVKAYIGLGSNLSSPRRQLAEALQALAQLPQTQLLKHSGLYQSQAIGPGPQPDYLNGAALVNTQLDAAQLLQALHHIEDRQGRVRRERWGARTLDLDLLLYGHQQSQSSELLLPHPRLQERAFVVLPLLEIAPDLILPDGRKLAEVATAFIDESLPLVAPASTIMSQSASFATNHPIGDVD